MTAVVWLLAVVVAVLALLVVGLLRSHAEILRALHDAGMNLDPGRADQGTATTTAASTPATDAAGLVRTRPGVPEPAGTTGRRAAPLVGLTPSGAMRTISVHGEGATLLAFLTTGCGTCLDFWSAFGEGVTLPDGIRLVVVAKGPDQESPADVAALAPAHELTIQSNDAWDDYGVPVAPYFALVDGRSGVVVGEGAASSWERVQALLDRAMADAGYVGRSVSRRSLLSGRARAERVDRELLDAGLTPGDPRLFHEPVAEPGDGDA